MCFKMTASNPRTLSVNHYQNCLSSFHNNYVQMSKSKLNTLSDFVDSLWSTPLCYYSYLSSLFLDQIVEFRNNSSADLIKVSVAVIFLNRSLLQAHIDIKLIAKQHRNGGKHGGGKGCHHHLILEVAVIVQQVCHVHHVHPRLASLC